MIVREKVVLNGTVLLRDWRFDHLFGGTLHSQSELLRLPVNSYCNIIINIGEKILTAWFSKILEFIDFVVEKVNSKMNKIILSW